MALFERAAFGNKGGSHQLLSTTIASETSVLDQLQFLVDRPAGHVDSSVTWSPYWGCQKVDAWWVIWRGEEDPDAPRRNMVKVEVALLSLAQCALLDDLKELLVAVGYDGENHHPKDALKLAGTIVERLSTAPSPVALPDISLAPTLLRTLWPRLWPSARVSLSLRTVFAVESLEAGPPPRIAVFPTELMPRWHGYPILEGPESADSPITGWFASGTSPKFERLLEANLDQLPGEFSVLARVKRIVERLECLHGGRGTVSDALVVARTQEAFSSKFNLPPRDLEIVSKTLAELLKATHRDIRTASLTRLDQIPNQDRIEAALAAWILVRLPEAPEQDVLWILQHHLSQGHALWWRRGVRQGLAAAFEKQSPEWARAWWNWCTQQPSAIEWFADLLDGSEAVENWLANNAPEGIDDDLLKRIVVVCREHGWATLLARTLGKGRPLVECIGIMREALRCPEGGIEALLAGRGDKEIVTATAATNWPPLIVRAAEITLTQPSLLGQVSGMPGFVQLLLAHLRGGGDLPYDVVKSDFLRTVFDGVLQRDQQLKDVADFLGSPAGPIALDHPFAEQLLCRVNAEVVSGAAAEWWVRFLADDRLDAPPRVLQPIIVDSIRARCEGESINLIIRLLGIFPEISEKTFVEWMKHTRFLWSFGDHEQVAGLLLERGWRSAAKVFRHSWKQELKLVAWYARDLLAWSDSFWWPPAGVDATDSTIATSPKSKINTRRRQMKISFLASNPLSSGRLALDEEARQIEEKVRDAKHRDLVSIRTRWAVRPQDLQQALLEDEPVVVHFSGHGGGAVGIVLHSQDQNKERLVDESALADLFRVLKDDIRVVVLNACYSEAQANAIVQEIDFVVGMSDSIGDVAARVFASAFYRGLAFGRTVQNSFDLGINELRLARLDQEDHIPRLLVRPGVDSSAAILVGETS